MSIRELLPSPATASAAPTDAGSTAGRALSPDGAGTTIRLEHLVYRCGHYEPGSPVNGGYGCRHPEQSERRTDLEGRSHGCCFSFSCPVAATIYADSERDVAIMAEQHPDVAEIVDGVWMLWDGKYNKRDIPL